MAKKVRITNGIDVRYITEAAADPKTLTDMGWWVQELPTANAPKPKESTAPETNGQPFTEEVKLPIVEANDLTEQSPFGESQFEPETEQVDMLGQEEKEEAKKRGRKPKANN